MRIRKHDDATKVELQMTPMIDVVFQLLVFFLFSFKIVPTEGEIGVNMPPITAGAKPRPEQIEITEKVRIRLQSSEEGALVAIFVGENELGASLPALTQMLRDSVVGPSGMPDDAEVEIDADRRLLYHFIIRAVNAVQRAGIKKVNFTDPLAAPVKGE